MAFLHAFFWISLSILIYTYAGYALLLYLYNNIKKAFTPKANLTTGFQPSVTLIVPAYNEADQLEAKARNCISLNYPPDKLDVLFITDGSTDNPENYLREYKPIRHFHQPERLGKMAAINRAMQQVCSEIVIFSDANTILNKEAVQLIVQHYANPKIGGVAGEKKVEVADKSANLVGEGIYWQYESKMKQLDSDLYTVVGAAGELFSMRTSLFKPQAKNILLDDFILSMKICLAGCKVIYEPLAFAIETPSNNLKEESKRRIRIAAGAFQSLLLLPGLLNFFKHPLLSFQYFSRRVLRWVFSPLALIILYVSNLAIVVFESNTFFNTFFIVQNLAYLLACIGWQFRKTRNVLMVFVPFYFVFMNAALILGFVRFITGRQTVLWEKSKRKMASGDLFG